MSITAITSTDHLSKLLAASPQKLSVIDFHATWCGPCHQIAPTYEAFSKQYTAVNFLKCDVDKVPDVARLYSVSAMPTFVFLKGSTKVDQVRGADRAGIEAALQKHASPSSGSGAAFSGAGQTLGDGSSVKHAPRSIASRISTMDPQTQLLVGMLAVFLIWSYFL